MLDDSELGDLIWVILKGDSDSNSSVEEWHDCQDTDDNKRSCKVDVTLVVTLIIIVYFRFIWRMTSVIALANTCGLVEVYMKDSGRTMSDMAPANTLRLMAGI